MIRFTENKRYIQGMLNTNNSKIIEKSSTTFERQVDKSTKVALTEDPLTLNLENKDDDSLLNRVIFTSE